MQLIGDGVTMIDALHQKTYTREEVIKKMGVPPEQIPDFLALVGDTSDNIPGIRGVGDKTAASLLEQYGTLETLIAANPVVPRIAVKQPFSDPEQLERVTISRKLVELERDVPLPMPLEELVVGDWDLAGAAPAVHRARVPGARREGQDADAAVATTWSSCRRPRHARSRRSRRAAIRAIVVRPRRDRRARRRGARRPSGMAITVELDPERAERAQLVAIVIAVPGRAPAYIPLGHRYIGAPAPPPPADLAPLHRVLEDPTIAKVCHDAKTVDRARSRTSASRSRASSTTRCSPRSCSIRRRRPSRARRSRSGSAASMLPARATIAGAREAQPRGRRGRARGAVGRRDRARAAADRGAAAGAARRRRARRAVSRRSSCRSRGCSRRSSASASTSTSRTSRSSAAEVDARSSPSSSARSTSSPASEFNIGSPKQLGELLFEKLGLDTKGVRRTKTGLVDRGRDARAARAPDHRADPRAPRARQAQGHVPRRAAAAGLPEDRPPAHDVQPGRRRDRADLVAGSEPPEHPDPQRARHARSGAASSRRRATC